MLVLASKSIKEKNVTLLIKLYAEFNVNLLVRRNKLYMRTRSVYFVIIK